MRHIVPHVDIAVLVLLVLIVLYKPPTTSGKVMAFIEKHFGDSVGFYILHLGIILIVIGGVYPQVQGVEQIGNSLIIAAMGLLKLSKTAESTITTTTPAGSTTVATAGEAAAQVTAAPVPPKV